MSEKKPEDYVIFNDFESLETIDCHVESRYTSNAKSKFCEHEFYDSNNNPDYGFVNTCKRFVTLFDTLMENCSNDVNLVKERKYPEFMNFWINYKLKETGYSEKEQRQFYEKMASNYDKFINDEMI